MTRSSSGTRGASAGDMLVFLATFSVAGALLYPAWSVRGFRAQVDGAVADVEALEAAARSVRDDQGRWPAPAPPGEAPPELAGGVFERGDYVLGWTSWDVVDSVAVQPDLGMVSPDDVPEDVGPRMAPVVRRVGAVTVHSGDEGLLAELLERYADEGAFVIDTLWLLVLPERGEAPAAR